MIRVLIVNHTRDLRAGRGERVLHGLVRELDQSRFEATLCLPAGIASTEFEYTADEIVLLPRAATSPP